ncbi:MAG: hypothetical protein HKN32_08645 [Flavobacteriales bacterium]|nr:hypothetical protein [Flavobacteriales bacterium]
MPIKSFSEQRAYLDEKLASPELFGGPLFNYMKIVQHGLLYANNEDKSKLIRNYLSFPNWIIRLIYLVKSRKHRGNGFKPALKEFIILEPGRWGKGSDGSKLSMYFNYPVAILGREKCSIIHLNSDPEIDGDFRLRDIIKGIGAPSISGKAKSILKEARRAMNSFHDSPHYSETEKRYVQSAFHIFLEEFLVYNALFSSQKSKVCLFFPHYHREGMIAAGKLNGIKMVELQHGLIAENDLYYAYPEAIRSVSDKALFADKILVMGDYWKDVLLRGSEYSESQIFCVGDYMLTSGSDSVSKKKDQIFIGAQKNMASEYVAYTKQLLSIVETKYPNWTVVLKTHPLEKELDKYREIKHRQFTLKGNNASLTKLLDESRIQISIYSTTFFDALGKKVVNFSLQDYSAFSDYAEDMVKENVAYPLAFQEDPIEKLNFVENSATPLLGRTRVYGKLQEKDFLGAVSC